MTAPDPSLRRRVELAAGPLVILLAKLPRIVPFALILTLLLAGLFLEGVAGGLLLLVLAAVLGLLLLLAWPALQQQARVLRLVVLALLVVRAITFLI